MSTRQTKIIATLGPRSNSFEAVEALYLSGANFFRLNFSHLRGDDHLHYRDIIDAIRKKHGADIGILADLQGPKIRIGAFADDCEEVSGGVRGIRLTPGMRLRFDLDPAPGGMANPGENFDARVCLPHEAVIDGLEQGHKIRLDDGNIELQVSEKGHNYIVARVLMGEHLSARKGVNVPELAHPLKAFTDKDVEDLQKALDIGAEWIALSFVQSARDVRIARQLIAEKEPSGGRHIRVLSKIEKPSALLNIMEIIEESDGVMIARGDLGVEIRNEEVPVTQEIIVTLTRSKGKPAIVATEMLGNMILNPRPTRAETTDVHWAVRQGASAVMLSGETAVGQYGPNAVAKMAALCQAAEDYMHAPDRTLREIFGSRAVGIFSILNRVGALPHPHHETLILVPQFGTWGEQEGGKKDAGPEGPLPAYG